MSEDRENRKRDDRVYAKTTTPVPSITPGKVSLTAHVRASANRVLSALRDDRVISEERAG